MGVHVSIIGEGGEHPSWDWFRHAGDREVFSTLEEAGSVRRQIGHPYDAEFWYRPEDIKAFEAAMTAKFPENKLRWAEMAKILRDPQWWLRFSW